MDPIMKQKIQNVLNALNKGIITPLEAAHKITDLVIVNDGTTVEGVQELVLLLISPE